MSSFTLPLHDKHTNRVLSAEPDGEEVSAPQQDSLEHFFTLVHTVHTETAVKEGGWKPRYAQTGSTQSEDVMKKNEELMESKVKALAQVHENMNSAWAHIHTMSQLLSHINDKRDVALKETVSVNKSTLLSTTTPQDAPLALQQALEGVDVPTPPEHLARMDALRVATMQKSRQLHGCAQILLEGAQALLHSSVVSQRFSHDLAHLSVAFLPSVSVLSTANTTTHMIEHPPLAALFATPPPAAAPPVPTGVSAVTRLVGQRPPPLRAGDGSGGAEGVSAEAAKLHEDALRSVLLRDHSGGVMVGPLVESVWRGRADGDTREYAQVLDAQSDSGDGGDAEAAEGSGEEEQEAVESNVDIHNFARDSPLKLLRWSAQRWRLIARSLHGSQRHILSSMLCDRLVAEARCLQHGVSAPWGLGAGCGALEVSVVGGDVAVRVGQAQGIITLRLRGSSTPPGRDGPSARVNGGIAVTEVWSRTSALGCPSLALSPGAIATLTLALHTVLLNQLGQRAAQLLSGSLLEAASVPHALSQFLKAQKKPNSGFPKSVFADGTRPRDVTADADLWYVSSAQLADSLAERRSDALVDALSRRGAGSAAGTSTGRGRGVGRALGVGMEGAGVLSADAFGVSRDGRVWSSLVDGVEVSGLDVSQNELTAPQVERHVEADRAARPALPSHPSASARLRVGMPSLLGREALALAANNTPAFALRSEPLFGLPRAGTVRREFATVKIPPGAGQSERTGKEAEVSLAVADGYRMGGQTWLLLVLIGGILSARAKAAFSSYCRLKGFGKLAHANSPLRYRVVRAEDLLRIPTGGCNPALALVQRQRGFTVRLQLHATSLSALQLRVELNLHCQPTSDHGSAEAFQLPLWSATVDAHVALTTDHIAYAPTLAAEYSAQGNALTTAVPGSGTVVLQGAVGTSGKSRLVGVQEAIEQLDAAVDLVSTLMQSWAVTV